MLDNLVVGQFSVIPRTWHFLSDKGIPLNSLQEFLNFILFETTILVALERTWLFCLAHPLDR